jgi:hypothetical protein
MRSKNFVSVKSSVKSEGQLASTAIQRWKVLIATPATLTREIRFDGSSAILVAATKIDVERLKNLPRLFRLARNSD